MKISEPLYFAKRPRVRTQEEIDRSRKQLEEWAKERREDEVKGRAKYGDIDYEFKEETGEFYKMSLEEKIDSIHNYLIKKINETTSPHL